MSGDYQTQINTLVEDFVGKVTGVARAAAMETLNAALGLSGTTPGHKQRAAVTGAAPGARRKGEKRPAAELEKMQERVRLFVAQHPGLRVEEINKELGTTTAEIALPLRKLITDGSLRSEGQKRSTQYFPANGSTPKERSAPQPKRRKKK